MSAFTEAFSIAVTSAVASPAARAFLSNVEDKSNAAAASERHNVRILMGLSPV
jgi:hypothetical protein